MKKSNKVLWSLIWYMIIAVIFISTIVINMIYYYKGEISPAESNMFSMILFGFLLTWHRIDEHNE